jgi:Ca2+-transporting ATPase
MSRPLASTLQKWLITFGKQLVVGVSTLCLLFFTAGWWRGEPLGQLLLGSILLVMVTIALALGAKRLVLNQPALTRKATRRGNRP